MVVVFIVLPLVWDTIDTVCIHYDPTVFPTGLNLSFKFYFVVLASRLTGIIMRLPRLQDHIGQGCSSSSSSNGGQANSST
eukprot:385322-Rhodomonas_salina.3